MHLKFSTGFRALGIRSCGLFVSLADSNADCRQALSEMFGVDKAIGPLHMLAGSKLLLVWNQAKTRSRRWRPQRGHTVSTSSFLMVLGETCSKHSPVVTATPSLRKNFRLSATLRRWKRCYKTGCCRKNLSHRLSPWKRKPHISSTTQKVPRITSRCSLMALP